MDIILNNKKKEYRHSLRWKLFFSHLAISFIPLIIFSFIMINYVKDYLKTDKSEILLTDANIIAGNISKGNYLSDESKRNLFDNELETKSNEGSYRILIFDSRGTVVNDSNKTEIGKTYVLPDIIKTISEKDHATLHEKEKTIYASASILNQNSEKVGAVLIVSSANGIYSAVETISDKLAIVILITLPILLVLVTFISRIIIDPLKNILSVIEKMSDGHLNRRIQIETHDEFGELSKSFNEMTAKLETVEKSRQEFVSNVSHELKTPLSSIKILSGSLLAQDSVPTEIYVEFLNDINSEVDRMTEIVDDLLTLVKLDQREIALNISITDFNKMLAEICKTLKPLADNKNISLEFNENQKVITHADKMKLSLAISNLVENAIKYTPEFGKVTVSIDSDNQNTYIVVEDTGIGISEEEQGKIFERFYRVDKTRDRETGGTGLGLAITHSTILMHNGSINLNSEIDKGTVFTVKIPLDLKNNH